MYTRDELVEDLKLIWKKNKPVKAVLCKKNGKEKEFVIWGLAIGKKRKAIKICMCKK